jgi:hypothetical protein
MQPVISFLPCSHLVTARNELHRNQLLRLDVAHELCHTKAAAADVFQLWQTELSVRRTVQGSQHTPPPPPPLRARVFSTYQLKLCVAPVLLDFPHLLFVCLSAAEAKRLARSHDDPQPQITEATPL